LAIEGLIEDCVIFDYAIYFSIGQFPVNLKPSIFKSPINPEISNI